MSTANAPLSIGKVTLTVHDLEGVTRFYQQAVGLAVLEMDAAQAKLGVGGTVLLELRRDPHARRRSPNEAGLFHTAFLLPARGDLARWLVHAAEAKVALQGAADHLVSEALYLADPEGNGIEIYIDRPREVWTRTGALIAMSSDPLDIDGLMASTEGRDWRGFPEGSVIGHVHLQVGTIAPAEEFYTRLGFDITCHYPGATFYGSGGYHHHLATNIWNSRNAPARSGLSTGLADVEIVAADADTYEAARLRLSDGGHPRGDALQVVDPWGTALTIRPLAI
jgi:catechol 2,3-dioxygenase